MTFAIKTENLTKVFGQRVAVSGLNLSVKVNHIHGFLGPNGAGKSTTMKMMAGMIRPTSGRCFIMGHEVSDQHENTKNILGLLLENPPLYFDMSVVEYLDFVARLHGLKNTLLAQNIERTIHSLSLEKVAKRLIGNLSKGYKQRIGIAQAIVHNPQIVILDEPTVGLDPQSSVEMRELIRSLGKDHTILFSGHNLHEVSLICDEVSIIGEGKLLATGTPAHIAQNLKVEKNIKLEIGKNGVKLIEHFKTLDYVKHVDIIMHEYYDEAILTVDSQNEVRDELVRMVVGHNVSLFGLKQNSSDLEQLFLQVTGEKT